MEKKKKIIGVVIIVSAIIWGLIIIGCASALKETDCYGKIQHLLFVGVVSHLFFVWVPVVTFIKKK